MVLLLLGLEELSDSEPRSPPGVFKFSFEHAVKAKASIKLLLLTQMM